MTQINNLNIFTFIKDIYQSLKHIDQCFSTFNESVNTRLTKLEDTQQILIDKMTSIEIALNKLGETKNINSTLDKNIENELLKKMNIMNKTAFENDTVDLKPDELTFANILENGYTMLDINNSLETNTLLTNTIGLGNTPGLGNKYNNKIYSEYKPIDISDDLAMEISTKAEHKQTPQSPQSLNTLDSLLFD